MRLGNSRHVRGYLDTILVPWLRAAARLPGWHLKEAMQVAELRLRLRGCNRLQTIGLDGSTYSI
jgi:hypothetical protein